jgi:hypothetical protein
MKFDFNPQGKEQLGRQGFTLTCSSEHGIITCMKMNIREIVTKTLNPQSLRYNPVSGFRAHDHEQKEWKKIRMEIKVVRKINTKTNE